MRKDAAALLVCASLSGCFAKTQYKPTDFRGGYSDHEVQPDVHFVTFKGNGFTAREDVILGWHRRAAEICGGRSRYEIIAQGTQTTVSKTPDSYSSTVRSAGDVTYVDTRVNEGISFSKSRAEGYVRCVRPEPQGEEEQAPDLVALCEGGDGKACGAHAMSLSDAGDERKALVFVSKACRLGVAPACVYAAQAFELGHGIDRDVKRARSFWRRACRLGDDQSCEDLVRVTASLEEGGDAAACRAGDDEACAREIEARLSADDREGAVVIAAAGCVAGAGQSCMRAAGFFLEDHETTAAVEAFKAACQSGVDEGCDRFAAARAGEAAVEAKAPAESN
jgi:hypothetical protein